MQFNKQIIIKRWKPILEEYEKIEKVSELLNRNNSSLAHFN